MKCTTDSPDWEILSWFIISLVSWEPVVDRYHYLVSALVETIVCVIGHGDHLLEGRYWDFFAQDSKLRMISYILLKHVPLVLTIPKRIIHSISGSYKLEKAPF